MERAAAVSATLVENALKFSAEIARPRVSISASGENGTVLCRVGDNGPGIEPRYRQRVFELFGRLDTRIPGTGIGLALVKRNIEVHGGKIWIESETDGRGTRVCFTLPAP